MAIVQKSNDAEQKIYYDPFFKNVKTLEKLKKEVDWPEVKAFLENGDGVDLSTGRPLPAYRIVREFKGEGLLKSIISKGRFFSFDEITLLRDSCRKLYDFTLPKLKNVKWPIETDVPIAVLNLCLL